MLAWVGPMDTKTGFLPSVMSIYLKTRGRFLTILNVSVFFYKMAIMVTFFTTNYNK